MISVLDSRFTAPKSLKTINFLNPDTKHKIRFLYISRDQNDKSLVILPGLSEFSEKYFETMTDFSEQGFDVYVIDWAYQGLSTRFSQNPHKRHSDGFHTDVSDLHFLISHFIRPKNKIFMLGHSMGGHIGLRYLIEYPDHIKAASFSAPMAGILDLKNYYGLINILKPVLSLFKNFYIPGGQNWTANARPSDGSGIFSHDRARDALHNYWCLQNPALQVGNVTIEWVLQAVKSICFLRNTIEEINMPVLLALAKEEKLVDNNITKELAATNNNFELLELSGARHEILMEIDDIRNHFIQKTLSHFNQSD